MKNPQSLPSKTLKKIDTKKGKEKDDGDDENFQPVFFNPAENLAFIDEIESFSPTMCIKHLSEEEKRLAY